MVGYRVADIPLGAQKPAAFFVVAKRMVPGKARIRLRFYEHELTQLDSLVRSSGCPSRTRLLNILIEHFLRSQVLAEFGPCRKRTVKFLLDPPVLQRLLEAARSSGMASNDIIRMALRRLMEHLAN